MPTEADPKILHLAIARMKLQQALFAVDAALKTHHTAKGAHPNQKVYSRLMLVRKSIEKEFLRFPLEIRK
jgi:hypothetical protein